jgi:hypothetical protein
MQTDTMKLIGAFREYATAPKNRPISIEIEYKER